MAIPPFQVPDRFNAASFFVDRHVTEGRGGKVAFFHEGGELTFAGMPQFGLSADIGYRHLPAPFVGFKADPLSLSLAGHWYIK